MEFDKSRIYYCLSTQEIVTGKELLEGFNLYDYNVNFKKFFESDYIEAELLTRENIKMHVDIYNKLDNLCASGFISDALYNYISSRDVIANNLTEEVARLYISNENNEWQDIRSDCDLYNCDKIYLLAICNLFSDIINPVIN